MIEINGKSYTEDELKVLEKADMLSIGAKNDVTSTTPTGTNPYGPNPGNSAQFGPFSGAGVRPGMWSATPYEMGITTQIPWLPSVIYNEIIEVLTGVTDAAGTNQVSSGTVGARAGNLKVARQVYNFGIIHMATKIFDMTQVGMRKDRAAVDREFYNLAAQSNPLIPQVPGIMGDGIVASTLRQEMYALGMGLTRAIGPVMYAGSAGTEDNTYPGIARQWAGLDGLIKTGYTDSVTGLAAPALDSYVSSFNAVITGTSANSQDFVNALTDLHHGLQETERKVFGGTGGVVRPFVMRSDQFREAARQFAYALGVYVGAGTTAAVMNRDGREATRMFEDMMTSHYLLIDGEQRPVILDDHINREVVANNQYKADIYYPALSMDGRPLLYGEYFNMDNADARELRTAFGIGEAQATVLNNGLYLAFRRETGGIVEYDFFARPRLILDAPFLSGRLDDVIYNSYYRQTDSAPGDSYYRNGGTTYRS